MTNVACLVFFTLGLPVLLTGRLASIFCLFVFFYWVESPWQQYIISIYVQGNSLFKKS
jgi:hypothetical protein